MDCDKVLIVDAGIAKEFDKPSKLLEQPSLFGALAQEYATRSSDKRNSQNQSYIKSNYLIRNLFTIRR